MGWTSHSLIERRCWLALGCLGLAVLLVTNAQADLGPTNPDPAPLPRQTPGGILPRGFGEATGPIKDPNPEADPPYNLEPQDARLVAPPDHKVDILGRHGALARADLKRCQSCHKDQQCLDCHNGALRPEEVHGPGYIVVHPLEARNNPGRCASCHNPTTFCQDCHLSLRAGTGPASPAPGVGFHPPSWLGEVPGITHAQEARRNLNACVSCHSENDCASCHTNVNPHPPGWRARCKSIMQRDARSCTVCHADLSILRNQCL